MNDKTELPPDDQLGRANEITAAEARTAEPERQPQTRSRKVILIAVVALFAIAVIVGLLLWNRNKTGAGRPVPAPSTITEGPSTTAAQPQTAESTVTLSPQSAKNAGIKVETVGEQLLANSTATGALATGTVQANTYRTTPVVSLSAALCAG